MERKTLEERITKKEAAIAKIKKWFDNNLSKYSITEQSLINGILENGDTTRYKEWLRANGYYYGSDAYSKALEYRDSNITLLKYQNMLQALNNREATQKIEGTHQHESAIGIYMFRHMYGRN